MFVSETLLYVALPKTATTHIRWLLGQLVEGVQRSQHSLVRPEDFIDGRRFVGSIRSPWRYYLSLWAYGCKGMGGVRDRFVRYPAFQDLYSDVQNPTLFRQWLRLVLDNHEAVYPSHFKFYTGHFVKFTGLFTVRYCHWFLDPRSHIELQEIKDFRALTAFIDENCFVNDFIRLEQLESDFEQTLMKCGYQLTAKQRALVRIAPRSNSSSQMLVPANYYNDELIELVALRDRAIVNRFSYGWPESLLVPRKSQGKGRDWDHGK